MPLYNTDHIRYSFSFKDEIFLGTVTWFWCGGWGLGDIFLLCHETDEWQMLRLEDKARTCWLKGCTETLLWLLPVSLGHTVCGLPSEELVPTTRWKGDRTKSRVRTQVAMVFKLWLKQPPPTRLVPLLARCHPLLWVIFSSQTLAEFTCEMK